MIWHNCNNDLPQEEGFYLLVYNYEILQEDISYDCNDTFDRALYKNQTWHLLSEHQWIPISDMKCVKITPLKWAKIDLEIIEKDVTHQQMNTLGICNWIQDSFSRNNPFNLF